MNKLNVEEAIDCLLDNVEITDEVETVDLQNCLGGILAEDVVAAYDNPPFNRSPLDGYAVRGDDVKNALADKTVKLKVVGKIYAGQTYDGFMEKGQAVRIMTGAMIPVGADAVIRQEDTDYGAEYVEVRRGVSPFSNYCHAGEDYKKGDILVNRGIRINAGIVSLIASTGAASVKIYKSPRISVIATGDELIKPGDRIQAGKIYDSNMSYITSRLQELSLPTSYSIHVEDDADKLTGLIKEQARDASLIITTGGVSVGERDILHEVVKRLEAKQLFWKVRMKPGTPTLAFVTGKTLVVSLSGNPFGAVTGFEILVRPVLAKMCRNNAMNSIKLEVCVSNDFDKASDNCRFVRGHYDGNTVSVVEGNHSSGAISSMVHTNCLIEIEAGRNGIKAGEKVNSYLL